MFTDILIFLHVHNHISIRYYFPYAKGIIVSFFFLQSKPNNYKISAFVCLTAFISNSLLKNNFMNIKF